MDPAPNFRSFSDFWNTFTPSQNGYIDPRPSRSGILGLQSKFKEGVEKLKTIDTKFLGAAFFDNSLDPGLTVEGVGPLRPPLNTRYMQDLDAHRFIPRPGCTEVPPQSLKTYQTEQYLWNASLGQTLEKAWGPLRLPPTFRHDNITIALRSLVVMRGHEIAYIDETNVKGNSSGLVCIVLLPTIASAINLKASYASKPVGFNVKGDFRDKTIAVVL
ncbi:hypothetical protein V5O48_011564, partial [Marasmius crinis-equi]